MANALTFQGHPAVFCRMQSNHHSQAHGRYCFAPHHHGNVIWRRAQAVVGFSRSGNELLLDVVRP